MIFDSKIHNICQKGGCGGTGDDRKNGEKDCGVLCKKQCDPTGTGRGMCLWYGASDRDDVQHGGHIRSGADPAPVLVYHIFIGSLLPHPDVCRGNPCGNLYEVYSVIYRGIFDDPAGDGIFNPSGFSGRDDVVFPDVFSGNLAGVPDRGSQQAAQCGGTGKI